MIRAFVLYESEPDPERYEQHAELCRQVPGGSVPARQGLRRADGRAAPTRTTPSGSSPTATRSRRPRAASEFMATGKDAMEMGGRFHVLFADVS